MSISCLFQLEMGLTKNLFTCVCRYIFKKSSLICGLNMAFFKRKKGYAKSQSYSTVKRIEPTIIGIFDGFKVEVVDPVAIMRLNFEGDFGKGNLSRSTPQCPRNDSTNEISETLHLTLEEAFFLSYALGCLQVKHNENVVSLDQMWNLFRTFSEDFLVTYAAYHHFRTQGWVVKSGLKYGTKFLLYKDGIDHYHASYSVLVRSTTDQDLNWTDFAGINRITETAAKEILICTVFVSACDFDTPNCLNKIKIHTNVFKRWVAAQERDK